MAIQWENTRSGCKQPLHYHGECQRLVHPQNIPFHGEEANGIENTQYFRSIHKNLGKEKNTWQPWQDLSGHKKERAPGRNNSEASVPPSETTARTQYFLSLPPPNLFFVTQRKLC